MVFGPEPVKERRLLFCSVGWPRLYMGHIGHTYYVYWQLLRMCYITHHMNDEYITNVPETWRKAGYKNVPYDHACKVATNKASHKSLHWGYKLLFSFGAALIVFMAVCFFGRIWQMSNQGEVGAFRATGYIEGIALYAGYLYYKSRKKWPEKLHLVTA